uniref:Uncharacterized protein n=1 Tax=viral metagenome TaxID=1070528 RepID=A0A6M3LQZ8_9ZZZZ
MKSKQQKREEAEARQEIYNSLTFGQKVKNIMHRPGRSHKELNKLYAIEVQKNGGQP